MTTSHTRYFLFAIVDIMCGVSLEDVWEDIQAAQAAPPGEYVYLHSAPPTRWLQTLYSRHMRTVTVNGTTTGWFLLESSVPQGDVMASTAFILYIEALGILLRTDPNIAGVTLPSGQQMVDARFADDTGVAVTPPSIDAVMRAVEVFSAASGMVNHCIKTVGIWAGAWWRRITAWEQAAFADDLLAATGRTPRLTWLRCGSVLVPESAAAGPRGHASLVKHLGPKSKHPHHEYSRLGADPCRPPRPLGREGADR